MGPEKPKVLVSKSPYGLEISYHFRLFVVMKGRYVLRVFLSAKHMTANVVEWNERRVVATASTVEHAIRDAFEWGRGCNEKAAESVGEVLAMRLKTEEPGVRVRGGGVHIDVEKEIKTKGLESGERVWAVVNALGNRGVKVVIEDAPNKE